MCQKSSSTGSIDSMPAIKSKVRATSVAIQILAIIMDIRLFSASA
jgi:hypothetical protein